MGMGRQEGESLGKSLLVFNREDVVNTVGSQVERRGKLWKEEEHRIIL